MLDLFEDLARVNGYETSRLMPVLLELAFSVTELLGLFEFRESTTP
jgi:hypothetical protein